MKKIVVACGSGIATSTAVEAKVKDLLDNNGLSISCPYVSGVPFLTTIGKAAAEQQILEALKK